MFVCVCLCVCVCGCLCVLCVWLVGCGSLYLSLLFVYFVLYVYCVVYWFLYTLLNVPFYVLLAVERTFAIPAGAPLRLLCLGSLLYVLLHVHSGPSAPALGHALCMCLRPILCLSP